MFVPINTLEYESFVSFVLSQVEFWGLDKGWQTGIIGTRKQNVTLISL